MLSVKIRSGSKSMGAAESIDKDLIEFKSNDRVGIYRHVQVGGQNFIEIQRELPNQRIFDEWMERVKDVRLSMVGVDVLFLPVKQTYSKTELCGSGGTLRVVFEEWENFLKDEIATRRKNQSPYQQEEIWFIFYCLVQAGVLYEGRNEKLGDMHPNNIVVTPQGFVRLISRDSFPLEPTNFEKIVQEIKTDVYLSPEQMDESMIESGVYTLRDPSRADVFSFGITMLQAITLQNCSYLYIRNPLRISFEKLELYINVMRERYSKQLYDAVVSVLERNPNRRKSFLQLYQMLRPHEEKIMDFQPFSLIGSRAKQQEHSVSQSRVPEQSRSMNGSIKVPVSPPTQQHFGYVKRV